MILWNCQNWEYRRLECKIKEYRYTKAILGKGWQPARLLQFPVPSNPEALIKNPPIMLFVTIFKDICSWYSDSHWMFYEHFCRHIVSATPPIDVQDKNLNHRNLRPKEWWLRPATQYSFIFVWTFNDWICAAYTWACRGWSNGGVWLVVVDSGDFEWFSCDCDSLLLREGGSMNKRRPAAQFQIK